MEIKILGPGCATCHKLADMAMMAVEELGMNASVESVTDIEEIRKYTLTSPGLLIDGKLRHAGKPLPTLEKLKELIKSSQ